MKYKSLIITGIIILLIVGGIFLFFKLKYECGDRVCELHELKTCDNDCKPECNYEDYRPYLKFIDLFKGFDLVRNECSMNWEEYYTRQRLINEIPDDFILRTKAYDYDDREIQEVIDEIKAKDYKYSEQYAEDIGDYIISNIEYKEDLTYVDCLSNSASMVNSRGFGLCSTMSKLDIALLRGIGLASKPVTGCLSEVYTCSPLRFEKGILQAIIKPEIRQPKVEPIKIEDGIVVSRGGLHTWVEVWLPERGWTILEPTTGYLIDRDCVSYRYLNPFANEIDMCGISYSSNKLFVDNCRVF